MTKNYKSVELPSNYAWELLESEIELEVGSKTSLQLVQKLLELYALGVEYFESLRSYKYLYFQKKMNTLMISPQFMNAMNNSKAEPAQKSSNNPPKKTQAQLRKEEEEHTKILLAKNRQDELQKQMKYSTAEVSAAKVKNIIDNTNQQANELTNKIQSQLQKQHSEILDKVERRRKKAILSKSFSLAEMTRHSSRDQLSNPDDQTQKKDLKLQKIRVDFTNIINENQQDEEQKPRRKKTQDLVKAADVQKPKPQEKPTETEQEPTIRKRNNTLKGQKKGGDGKLKPNGKTHSQGIPEICDFAEMAS